MCCHLEDNHSLMKLCNKKLQTYSRAFRGSMTFLRILTIRGFLSSFQNRSACHPIAEKFLKILVSYLERFLTIFINSPVIKNG